MGRLHRLVDDRQQITRELRQIHLITLLQASAESSQRLGRIILAAIEAAINDLMEELCHLIYNFPRYQQNS